ncbi:bestrophin-2-like [Brevipalpus obovatus]|uniref:bestrophin-2-like n=1 Tax=Brevipalpus obovatus TaxID=246614 RepID=UPI003D9F6D13
MTVTYSLSVANTRLNGFAKLLIRWRGSIYKLLYREMFIFCVLYYSLSILYRYLLVEHQRRVFEKVALYCEAFTKLIPLSFVLGFYVSIVVNRWWKQYLAIPWPDDLLMMISGYIHGNDERGRIIRRTLARYLLLLEALTFQAVSTSVHKRFPTEDHLVEAGLMTKEEKIAYDEIPSSHGKYWAPAVWFTTLTVRARKEGRIRDDVLLRQILEALYSYRSKAGDLFAFDWISIPLVYTQSVTLAVYTYFCATTMSRQYLDPTQGYSGHEIDLYVPIFTILEFFFFMGWLKVAEQLINPFGEDDDDFELNWILDRNLVVSMIIVDHMHNKFPKLVRDGYWDDTQPTLPYTRSSIGSRTEPYLGSAINLNMNSEDAEFIPQSLDTIMEDDVNDIQYTSRNQSPTNELLGLDFSNDNESYSTRRQPSSVSQSALNILPEFGSRLMNMIIGQSSENVSSSLPKASEKSSVAGQSLHGSFTLRSPRESRRRRRKASNPLKSSISSSLFSKVSADDIHTQPAPSPAISRRYLPSNMDERRSLVIDLEAEGLSTPHDASSHLHLNHHHNMNHNSNNNNNGAGHQANHSQHNHSRARPASVSVDETNSGNKYILRKQMPDDSGHNDDGSTSLVYESDLMDDGLSFTQSFPHLPPIAPTSNQVSDRRSIEKDPVNGNITISSTTEAINLPNSTSTLNSSTNNVKDSRDPSATRENGNNNRPTYEPSLSQESLTPESNQSTVTSMTQLIDKSNPKEVKNGFP